MARRGRVRYRTKIKRVYGKARSGGFKPITDGIIAGAGGQFLGGYIGVYAHPIATLATGYFMRNNTLKTEGARELGALLVANFQGGSSPYAAGGRY
jgi:hypothetical protein